MHADETCYKCHGTATYSPKMRKISVASKLLTKLISTSSSILEKVIQTNLPSLPDWHDEGPWQDHYSIDAVSGV